MRKFVALLVVLAAVPVAVAAQAAASSSSTLQVSTYKVLYGHRVTITGRASTHRAGQGVDILVQPYGRSTMTRAATVTTRAGGYWSYKAKPSIQTDYQARVGSSASRTLTVGVRPDANVKQLANGGLLVSVMAARDFKGRMVKLQRLEPGGAWRTIAKHMLRARSAAVVSTSLPTSTIRVAMSVNQAGAGYLGTTSHALRYHAHALTLVPAGFKVLFGRAVTLSGKLTNAQAGQKIAIYAWPFSVSQRFQIATVRTRADGSWSFSAKPSIQESFQAQWGLDSKSPRVRIGVRPNISIRELANGHIWAHVAAGVNLKGRLVKLQQRLSSGGWQTLVQKPLGPSSRVVFAKPLPASTIRVAMSVNQAGAGYLGSTSHALAYHGT